MYVKFFFIITLISILNFTESLAADQCLSFLNEKKPTPSDSNSLGPSAAFQKVFELLRVSNLRPENPRTMRHSIGMGQATVEYFDGGKLIGRDIIEGLTQGLVTIDLSVSPAFLGYEVKYFLNIQSRGLWNSLFSDQFPNKEAAYHTLPLFTIRDGVFESEQRVTENSEVKFDIQSKGPNELQITQTWQAPAELSYLPNHAMSDDFIFRVNFQSDGAGNLTIMTLELTKNWASTNQRSVTNLKVNFEPPE